MTKILIVEDESDLSKQMAQALSREHYLTDIAGDGDAALGFLTAFKYDIVILDWLLPGMTGLEICRKFRQSGGRTPILFLTANIGVENTEAALDAGADDYLAKPFHLKELLARLRALIRRSSNLQSTILEVRNIQLDTASHNVTKDGQDVHLEPREFNLLEFFLRNPNQVFSADTLLARVWDAESQASSDTIRTYIKSLRKKLDDSGRTSIIATVHGVGYRLDNR